MAERFDTAYEYEFVPEAVGDSNISVSAKGIEGGDALDAASAETLLEHHLELEKADVKNFWKDGYILFKLWVSGSYRTLRADKPYPWTKEGLFEFLHDRKSQIGSDEVGRRIKVFRTYNKYEVPIIRRVERAGVNKAFAAIPHITDENVSEVLDFCIETPYFKLRTALQVFAPRLDGGGRRQGKSKDQQRRENETRAVRTISDCNDGMVGPLFVPRQYKMEPEDEMRARLVMISAMNRLGVNDRDSFFINRVVKLVSDTWLNDDDRKGIEQQIRAYMDGRAANKAVAAE